MITKEEIVKYFKDLRQDCDECSFVKECSLAIFDGDHVLCDYITAYDN